jgi:cytochrome c-type biogenesis protein
MEIASTAFLLGLLATTSPCVLPLYPGFLAYLSGQVGAGPGRQRYFLGLAVLGGVLTMMLALGGLIAALAISIGRALAFIIPLADFVILLLGLLLLFNRNPFRSLPQIRIPLLRQPLLNAYLYGLLYGPIAMPCSGPLVVAIFALSFTAAEGFSKLWVFAWFGLGFGVPLLILSVLSAALQKRLTVLFARHSRSVNIFGGLLLIGIATYDLAQNWEMLQAFYARLASR